MKTMTNKTLNTVASIAAELVESYSVQAEKAMVKACIELTSTLARNLDRQLADDCTSWLNDKGARHLVVGRIAQRAQVVIARMGG